LAVQRLAFGLIANLAAAGIDGVSFHQTAPLSYQYDHPVFVGVEIANPKLRQTPGQS
jgi:hypothetical protein